MAESRLQQLSARGQSVWIDYLSRDLLATGELKRMMQEDAVVGVTSNPTIFQKALSQGNAYDEQVKELREHEQDAKEIFLHLAVRDVETALDLLAPVHEANPQDGYVSIEVDPTFAYDTKATYDEAIRLHEWIDRPNLYVKIPGTEPGLQAIEDCIAIGRSINVTLIFSLQRYREVVEAYLRGLERLVAGGGDPAKVRSVASFFVSRVDTEADQRLDAIGTEAGLALRGKLAIANARLAYEHYLEAFFGPALGGPRRPRRPAAAVSVGFDLHEEPCVPGRPLRRGADRPEHGGHDARGDDPGVSGSRRGAWRHGARGSGRGAPAARAARRGRDRLRRRRLDARAGGRAEVLGLVRRAARRRAGEARGRGRVSAWTGTL